MDKVENIQIRTITLIIMILFAASWRIFATKGGFTFANFSPVGAMALFGGCYFSDKRKSYILPILGLFISDVIIMNVFYPEYTSGILYKGWYVTYAIFLAMVFFGSKITKVNVPSVLFTAVGISAFHWLVSNLFVWLGGGINPTTALPYAKNIQGLIECYTLAIPFFKNTLTSNLVFSGILFGAFELAKLNFPVLQRSHIA